MANSAEPNGFVVVMSTAPSRESAERIAARLLEGRLAACVQTMPIESRYIWEGKLERGAEVLLLIKARLADVPQIEAEIRAVHEYAVPEIVAIPIVAASSSYLGWMADVTARP